MPITSHPFPRPRASLPNITTIVLFTMIIGVAVSVLVKERRDFTAAVEKKGDSLAEFMAKVAPASILIHDVTTLYSYVEEVARDEEVIYAAILSDHGHVLAEYRDPEERTVADRVDIEKPIQLGGQSFGHVRIGLTKALVNQRVNREGIAVFVVTCLGIAFAYWRLKLYAGELELRVAERTMQLSESNRELQVQSEHAIRQARYLEVVYDASRLLHAESGTEELCRKLLELTRRATDARYAAIRTFDAQGQIATFFHTGLSPEEAAILKTPPADVGVLGAISLANPAVRLDDLTRDPRHRGYPADHPRMHTFLGVAISSGRRLLGKLYLTEKANGLPFTEEDAALVSALARDAALAIEKAQLLETVEALATTDHLTGLANRRVFTERLRDELDRSGRYGLSFGLLIADVDDFKKVNDTYGHSVGDTVLQTIASVLRHSVRDVDLCVRYGGEEFVVILPHADAAGTRCVAERIRKSVMSLPIVADDSAKMMSLSIGMALYPQDGTTGDELIRAADAALYQAKRHGKNCVVSAHARAA